jgi:glycosyltransferase involved in cell wall biosynthesis
MFSIQIDTAPGWRGGQNQVLLTTLGLRALGHHVVLVAHPEGELRRRAAEGGEVVAFAPRNEVDFSAGWKLSRIIRSLGPDIVHAHDPHAVAVASLALSLGAPVPGPALIASRRVDFHIRGNSFSRWKYGQVHCFVAASEAIRRMLIEDGIEEERTVTVHEGIDIDRVVKVPPINVRAELYLPTHAPVVGNVAALVPHKGQRHLIDAALLVVRAVPDARFVIVGEGELRPALEHQIKELHLERHVTLAGFRTDVLGLLKSFDLFAMSSVTEGLGTSLLDAMAASRAIVATTAGGIPEVVVDGKTGVLVPPRDAHAMAAAVVRLLGNERERTEMGSAGFARVCDRFGADRMVRETLAVYEQTLRKLRAAGTPPLSSTRDPA